MLYMVLEEFKQGSFETIRDRFQKKGRMLPDGAEYRASWLTLDGKKCYQVMESSSLELLQEWMSKWEDLMEFVVEPILPSSEFWAQFDAPRQP